MVLWCAVAWTFVAFMLYGSIGTIAVGNVALTPRHVLGYLFLDLFFALVPVVLLTGSFEVLDRVPWFRDQSKERVAAAVLVSVFVGLLGCGVCFD